MITNQEQRDNELLYILSEGLSEYLQGYTYEQGGPAFDTLETASLNLPLEFGRQGFNEGGLTGVVSTVSNVAGKVGELYSGIDPALTSGLSLAVNIASKSNPVSIALGTANFLSAVTKGTTITGAIMNAITDPTAYTGIIEDPVTGQPTTQSGRFGLMSMKSGETPDLSFSKGPPAGFTGTGGTNPATIPISVQDIAAEEAAGQGVAPGGAATTSGEDAPGATGTGATGVAAESGFGDPSTGDVSAGDTSADGDIGPQGGRASGGEIKGYQEGDLVEDDQADTQLDDLGLGPIGIVDDPDGTTGVADDLEMDLPDKSYVLNAEAVKLAGVGPINTMIKKAIDIAIEDGVDLPSEINTAEKIPIRISKGEAVLPHPL